MTGKERILSCLDRKGFDRIPVKYEAVPEISGMLCEHFGGIGEEELRRRLGVDYRFVSLVYCGPELREWPDGTWEGLWGERYSGRHKGAGVQQQRGGACGHQSPRFPAVGRALRPGSAQAALTIATIPALTGSGSVGQAVSTSARSGATGAISAAKAPSKTPSRP